MQDKTTEKALIGFFDRYRELLANALVDPNNDSEMKDIVRTLIHDIDHNLLKMSKLQFGELVQLVIFLDRQYDYITLMEELKKNEQT